MGFGGKQKTVTAIIKNGVAFFISKIQISVLRAQTDTASQVFCIGIKTFSDFVVLLASE